MSVEGSNGESFRLDSIDELALTRAEGEGMFIRKPSEVQKEVPVIKIPVLDKFITRGVLYEIHNPLIPFERQRIALYRGDMYLPTDPRGLPVLYENIDESMSDANWEGAPVVRYHFFYLESNN